MFTEYAARAKSLSENKLTRYYFTYAIKINERKTVEIIAKDERSAKLNFENEYPTARIINILASEY